MSYSEGDWNLAETLQWTAPERYGDRIRAYREECEEVERNRVLSRINAVLREPHADAKAMELAIRSELDAMWSGK